MPFVERAGCRLAYDVWGRGVGESLAPSGSSQGDADPPQQPVPADDESSTAPSSTTVVLVHSKKTNSTVWADVIPSLIAAGLRVVTIDMRGFGASVPMHDQDPAEGRDLAGLYSPTHFADDLVAVLDHADIVEPYGVPPLVEKLSGPCLLSREVS